MEKEGNKETYESKKVLGVLYRTMKPLLDDFKPEMTNVYDECVQGIPNAQYLQSALDVKKHYDIEMRNLMIEHNIPSEYEIFSGYLLEKSSARDYDLREKVAEQFRAVKEKFRSLCEGICDYRSLDPLDTSSKKKKRLHGMVSAMYHVTFEEKQSYAMLEFHQTAAPLISFPWIFPDVSQFFL